jgi:hypothetical protein
MGRWVLAASVLFSGACGSANDAEPEDAGQDARWEYPYCIRPVQRDEEPDDLERCGICVMPHERVINPHGISVWERATAAAIPAGLVVGDIYYGPYVSLITTEGEVVLLDEMPRDPEPLTRELLLGLYRQPYVVPVPGTNRFWIDSAQQEDPFLDRDGILESRNDLVLYEYDPEEGFKRLGSTYFDEYTFERTGLTGGELIAWRFRDNAVVRARALEDGSVDLLGIPFRDLVEGAAPRAGVITMWPLQTGDVALLGLDAEQHVDGTWAYATYVGILNGDLEFVVPWQLVGAPLFDAAYDLGLNPSVRGFAVANFPDGRAFLLAEGTVAGMGAAPWQHRFGTWVDADGLVEQEPPGIFINPDEFLRSVEITNEPIRTGIAVPLPNGRAGAIWNEFHIAGLTEKFTHGQVVEPDGTVVFDETLKFSSSDPRAIKLWWTQDGAGNAFLSDQNGVRRIGDDLLDVWPGRLDLGTCPTRVSSRAGGGGRIGAANEGVWAAWNDIVIEEASGLPVTVGKVTLIRPDGTFAWD